MTVHHHPADGLLVQILIAYDIWPKLTPKQRDVLTRQRKVRNPEAKVPSDRFLVIGEVKAAPRTMASLKRKGVVDDRGHLTLSGAYTVLYGPDYNRPAVARHDVGLPSWDTPCGT